MRPATRAYAWLFALLAVLLLLAAGAVSYLGSQAFLERAVRWAEEASAGRLELQNPSGSLFGEVRVGTARWRDEALAVQVENLSIDPAPLRWLRGTWGARSLHAGSVDVLAKGQSGAPWILPASLALPVNIEIDEITLDTLVWRRGEPSGGRPGAGTQTGTAGETIGPIRARLRYDGERFEVDALSVALTQAQIAARFSMADQQPYEIEAVARVKVPQERADPVAVDLRAWGTPETLRLELRTALREATVQARVQLAPLQPLWFSAAEIDVQSVDLSRFDARLPVTGLSGRIDLTGPSRAAVPGVSALDLTGRFQLANAKAGTLDTGRWPVDGLQGRLSARIDPRATRSGWRIDDLVATGPPGTVRGQVLWTLAQGQPIDPRLELSTEALDLSAVHPGLQSTQLAGSMKLAPAPKPQDPNWAITADLREGVRALTLDAVLAPDRALIRAARLIVPEGQTRFSGQIQILPPFRFALAGDASGFDPSRFARVAPGELNGTWRASGVVQPELALEMGLELSRSRWRGLPLQGSVQGRLEGRRIHDLAVNARWGATHVVARGSLGAAGDRMDTQVQAGNLREIDPRLAGRAQLRLAARGSWSRPALTGSLVADALHLDTFGQLGRLVADFDWPASLDEALTLVVRAADWKAGDRQAGPAQRVELLERLDLVDRWRSFERADLQVRGTLARHRIETRVHGPMGRTALQADGGLRGDFWKAPEQMNWQGVLLGLTHEGLLGIRLEQPAVAQWAPLRATGRLERARFSVDGVSGGEVVIESLLLSEKLVRARVLAERMPLRWLAHFLPLEGIRANEADTLRLGAKLELDAPVADLAATRGELSIFRESGDLRVEVPAFEGGIELVAAGITRTDLRVRLQGGHLDALLELAGASLGTVQARARSERLWTRDGRIDLNAPLEGSMLLDVPSLAWTRSVVGESWRFDGRFQAEATLAGSVGEPRLSGQLVGSELRAEQREIGLRFTDGELSARVRDNRLEIENLRFASGTGAVRMSGTLRARGDETARAVVSLSRVAIPIGPGQRLVLSGEAAAELSRTTLQVRGRLRADEGVLELTASDAPRLSRDVVLRRPGVAQGVETFAPALAPAASAAPPPPGLGGFRVRSDLEIELGERFRVFGGGFDARLGGAVTLRGQVPGEQRLFGTVRIAQGTYVGFGQTLQIERGTLVFTGAADNPSIDIVAWRRYLPVEAGVALTGTAQAPRLALVSRPEVPEADKLSWLVLGIGSATARTAGDTATLQAAAATILTASDSPFARGTSLAAALGLDVISVRTEPVGASAAGAATASAQDSVVTLGKRLTDRLFVSYEQSLRGLHNLLRLQYELTDRLSVRVKAGTESSVDLLWTYLYD